MEIAIIECRNRHSRKIPKKFYQRWCYERKRDHIRSYRCYHMRITIEEITKWSILHRNYPSELHIVIIKNTTILPKQITSNSLAQSLVHLSAIILSRTQPHYFIVSLYCSLNLYPPLNIHYEIMRSYTIWITLPNIHYRNHNLYPICCHRTGVK